MHRKTFTENAGCMLDRTIKEIMNLQKNIKNRD